MPKASNKTLSNQLKNKRRKKILFIHDSFTSQKKTADKTSVIISARNPFKKDDMIIDYDKDSEEEFMEENAEDLKSNDNSGDESELPAIEEEEEEGRKMGLSLMAICRRMKYHRKLAETEANTKSNGIKDILEIRKNYDKPIVINFNTSFFDTKTKLLHEALKGRIFKQQNEQTITAKSFPIKIESD